MQRSGPDVRWQACVLDLYRAGRELAPVDFRDFGLKRLSEIVPFDNALWCRAFVEDGTVRIYSVLEQRLPSGCLDAWAGLQERDELGAMAFQSLGQTVIASPAREVATDPALIEGLLERFDLAHFLTTCLLDPYTSLISSLTLTRRAASAPFTQDERAAKQALTAHLVEAEISSRLYSGLAHSRTGSLPPQAVAIADDDAMLEFSSADFAMLVKRGWPGWTGPRLPAEFTEDQGLRRTFRSRGFAVRSEPIGRQSNLVRIRPLQEIDRLSVREIEVARLIVAGSSNKEVGRQLALSPLTVRNHLSSAYRKLGIAKRGELVAFAEELT